MATLKEVGLTAVNGPDKELRTQEDAVREQPYKTAERRHVDALLDISEEDFFKELEPHEYHCYSGCEEVVRGWARVAPLSCILLTQKRYKKPKHKEADSAITLSPDPTIPNADNSASIAEHHCESRVGANKSFKKSTPSNQHEGTWSNTTVAALHKAASEWPVLNAMQKTTSKLSLEEKIEEEGMLRETSLQNRPTKPQKHGHRPNNAVVPIKNFTFLPPIKSPHLNPQRVAGQLCSSKKAPEEETIEDNSFMFDKKSGMKGTRVDPVVNLELPTSTAGLTSRYRTCQHNPHLFSAVSVSIPKRYQVPLSSKPDIVHHTSFSMGKSLTQALHSGNAAGAQARMHPSKTVCAVKMYEGCEINV
ncbi:uncharacterized protein C16orf46 homolog [Dicentrarchus labrax]|uniref:uncharacterized protein C16orf46 homolog n=1 Tax=Dicentrarchus labrax TaxID=13489 RepID=UPI0021F66A8A|nr:uncharacterized protein C16orf46 homolog [Dicentrarchus labrax]XP_051236486.1 uncharacterized protein C16orf46 homolog [Dicentrarchus labrax]